MRLGRILSWFLSIVLINVSIVLYFNNHYWFYPACIGVWLLFDNLNHHIKEETILDLFFRDKILFAELYIEYSIFGIVVEGIGNFFLHYWQYNYLSLSVLYISIPIFYPFILFSFREMYVMVKHFFRNKYISTLLSMILGVVIWEVPNLLTADWTYVLPFKGYVIYGIDVLVVLGWSILIIFPVKIYHHILNQER